MPRATRENVMLAYPAEKNRVSRLGAKFLCQPKLRGQRCRVEWFDGKPVLLSSYNIHFRYFQHIEEQLITIDRGQNVPYDGEIYVHGWTQEEINSVCNRTVTRHPKSEQMQYHIFDWQGEFTTQIERTLYLNNVDLLQLPENPSIFIVPTAATTVEDWIVQTQEYLNAGYEGIILRDPRAYYIPKRNVCLLKFKPTETDEYLILDIIEAISKDGIPKGMVGAFLVCGDDNVEFEVGAGKLKHWEREEIWNNKEVYKNKTLVVKHEPLTYVSKNNIPIAAVAVRIRG